MTKMGNSALKSLNNNKTIPADAEIKSDERINPKTDTIQISRSKEKEKLGSIDYGNLYGGNECASKESDQNETNPSFKQTSVADNEVPLESSYFTTLGRLKDVVNRVVQGHGNEEPLTYLESADRAAIFWIKGKSDDPLSPKENISDHDHRVGKTKIIGEIARGEAEIIESSKSKFFFRDQSRSPRENTEQTERETSSPTTTDRATVASAMTQCETENNSSECELEKSTSAEKSDSSGITAKAGIKEAATNFDTSKSNVLKDKRDVKRIETTELITSKTNLKPDENTAGTKPVPNVRGDKPNNGNESNPSNSRSDKKQASEKQNKGESGRKTEIDDTTKKSEMSDTTLKKQEVGTSIAAVSKSEVWKSSTQSNASEVPEKKSKKSDEVSEKSVVNGVASVAGNNTAADKKSGTGGDAKKVKAGESGELESFRENKKAEKSEKGRNPDKPGTNVADPGHEKENPDENVRQRETAVSSAREVDGAEAALTAETFELRTVQPDPRFQQQNVTKWCYTAFVDFHRCQYLLGKEDSACNIFRETYTSICPNSWIEKWMDQIARDVFPWDFRFERGRECPRPKK